MRTASLFATCGLLAICFFALTGCGKSKSSGPETGGTASAVRPHHHHHGHGPHGGHVIGLDTEEYHAEITQDEASHRVGVYVLDANATAAAPIEAASVTIDVSVDDKPTEYKLPAARQPDDAEGKSSYFEIESEPLFAILAGVEQSKAPPELKVTIDGKQYAGVIEDPHSQNAAALHGHSHGEDDALVWRQELKEQGYDIGLGHHGVNLLAGGEVEPALQLTRDGEPIADAQVFNTLLDADGNVLAEEVAAVYEPPTEDEPSHYAQGALMIPPGTREAVIRFRVVLPAEGGERTFDVPVTVR